MNKYILYQSQFSFNYFTFFFNLYKIYRTYYIIKFNIILILNYYLFQKYKFYISLYIISI